MVSSVYSVCGIYVGISEICPIYDCEFPVEADKVNRW